MNSPHEAKVIHKMTSAKADFQFINSYLQGWQQSIQQLSQTESSTNSYSAK